MSVELLSNGPSDKAVVFAFQKTEPNLEELITWSLVNKQFWRCSTDISLWQSYANKHMLTDCETGKQIKQGLIKLARRSFHRPPSWVEPCSTPPFHLFSHHVETRLPLNLLLGASTQFLCRLNDPLHAQNSSAAKYSFKVMRSAEFESAGIKGINEDVKVLEKREKYQNQLELHYLNQQVAQPYSIWSTRTVFSIPRKWPATPVNDPISYGQQYEKSIEWRLVKGGLKYITFTMPETTPYPGNEDLVYINYALKPLVQTLKKLEAINQEKIRFLGDFIPKATQVPPNFLCQISNKIMSNPVQDKCGHIFEKEELLKSLLAQKKEGYVNCPISKEIMPLVTSEYSEFDTYQIHRNHGVGEGTKFQKKILAWLQKLVGSDKEKEIAALEDNCMKSFMEAFSYVPSFYQQEVYGHLCDIQKRERDEKVGEDIFYGRNGQSSTKEEKMEALSRCIREEEINAFKWMF